MRSGRSFRMVLHRKSRHPPVMEAFQAAQADRQAFFDSLVQQKTSLTDAERLAVSERLGPQNIDMLNNELRGVLMSRMEMDNKMRQNVLSRMGLKQATAPDGTPLPTRQDGKSLFDARDMEGAVTKLLEKYKPERPSMRVSMPEKKEKRGRPPYSICSRRCAFWPIRGRNSPSK